tara:strand:- start:3725 stop:4285 length:561 start_codon:yes stop_codon:yes gene_type:complete
MRVIGGTLKGKKINFIRNLDTRPLKDSVKENIFNILIHSNFIKVKIEESNILDLYSGIGSFGIECLSRGAKKVTFIEKNKLASNILKENLTTLSIFEKSKIINRKIEDALEKNFNEKYNIFFLDPPFADNNFIKNLKFIKDKRLFEPNNLIVIHRERKTRDNLSKFIEIIKIKEYGRSKIIFGFFD